MDKGRDIRGRYPATVRALEATKDACSEILTKTSERKIKSKIQSLLLEVEALESIVLDHEAACDKRKREH